MIYNKLFIYLFMELLQQQFIESMSIFTPEGLQESLEIATRIRKRMFSISDVVVTNRWITNWSK